MSMTRQHYEALARSLGRAVAFAATANNPAQATAAAATAYAVALAVADSLQDTSPRYNRGRFVEAVRASAVEGVAVYVSGDRARATLEAAGVA